jgi:hypothetical protein
MLILRALVITGILALSGCSLLQQDHRANIAMQTLYGSNLYLDLRVFNAALGEKFPLGSSPQNLVKYVESLHGKCSIQSESDMVCTFPQIISFCLISYIKINAHLSQGQVFFISAETKTDGC